MFNIKAHRVVAGPSFPVEKLLKCFGLQHIEHISEVTVSLGENEPPRIAVTAYDSDHQEVTNHYKLTHPNLSLPQIRYEVARIFGLEDTNLVAAYLIIDSGSVPVITATFEFGVNEDWEMEVQLVPEYESAESSWVG